MIRFSELTDKLNYPRTVKGALSTAHSEVVAYCYMHYKCSNKFHRRVVDCLNMMSYYFLIHESIPDTWNIQKPLDNLEHIEETKLKETLKDMYLTPQGIEWDLTEIENATDEFIDKKRKDPADEQPAELPQIKIANISDAEIQTEKSDAEKQNIEQMNTEPLNTQQPQGVKSEIEKSENKEKSETQTAEENQSVKKSTAPKGIFAKREFELSCKSTEEDLYLSGPAIPRFDINKIFIKKNIDGTEYCIYKSLPEIPERQCEISVTTDETAMTDFDCLKLFPDKFFYTRTAECYIIYPGIDYDEKLGAIFPIEGFTKEEIKQNIIEYPHLENITRKGTVNGVPRLVNFWKYIEIDGTLYKINDKWNTFEISKYLPKTEGILNEYVVRRYLLERDIKKINHRYKMFGELDKYLTLFMPKEDYIKYNNSEIVNISRDCVKARINYLRSRNPVMRRIKESV